MNDGEPPVLYHSDGDYRSELQGLTPYATGYVEDLYVGVYSVSFDDAGNPRLDSEPSGRRCVLSEIGSGKSMLCDTVPSEDGTRVESICEGYYADSARHALTGGLSDPEVAAGQYELRWLSVPEFLIEGIWLKSQVDYASDLFRPVFHRESRLEGRDTLPIVELLAILEDLLQQRIAGEPIIDV